MSGTSYLILAYVLGLGLLWGYAVAMWRESRGITTRERARAAGAPEPDGGLS